MAPPESFTGQVLFVPEDPSNTRKRSRQETFAINSHVNGKYTRWRRDMSWKQLRAHAARSLSSNGTTEIKQEEQSTPAADKFSVGILDFTQDSSKSILPLRTATKTLSYSSEGQIKRKAKKKKPVSNGSLSDSSSTSPSSTIKTDDDDSASVTHQLQSQALTTILRNGNSDPFNATPVPMTAINHHAVKFACEYHATNIWPSEISAKNPENLSNVKWWVSPRQSIEHQPTLLGLLAWSFDVLHHNGKQRDELKALEYKSSAIIALKDLMQSLSDFESKLTAFETMLYFAATEWNNGNQAGTTTHYLAAKALLHNIGGLRELDARWRETTVWSMTNVSFSFAIRPFIDPDEFDPGPWSGEMYGTTSLDSLLTQDDTGSLADDEDFSLLMSQLSGSVISRVFRDMRNLLLAEESNADFRPGSCSERNEIFKHWFFARKLAIRGRLVHHFMDLIEASQSVEFYRTKLGGYGSRVLSSSFEMCMTSALMLYEIITLEKHAYGSIWFRRFRWIKGRHELLVGCLQKLTPSDRYQQFDNFTIATNFAMLWMLFVGAYAETVFLSQKPGPLHGLPEQLTDEDFETPKYCTNMFKEFVKYLGFEDVNRIRELFKTYFVFCQSMQDEGLMRVLKEG